MYRTIIRKTTKKNLIVLTRYYNALYTCLVRYNSNILFHCITNGNFNPITDHWCTSLSCIVRIGDSYIIASLHWPLVRDLYYKFTTITIILTALYYIVMKEGTVIKSDPHARVWGSTPLTPTTLWISTKYLLDEIFIRCLDLRLKSWIYIQWLKNKLPNNTNRRNYA